MMLDDFQVRPLLRLPCCHTAGLKHASFTTGLLLLLLLLLGLHASQNVGVIHTLNCDPLHHYKPMLQLTQALGCVAVLGYVVTMVLFAETTVHEDCNITIDTEIVVVCSNQI